MGSEKQSEAGRKGWERLTQKERKERLKKMHDARRAKWAGTSKKKRSEHARMMARARWPEGKTEENETAA